jgi:hypothetical protein
MANKIRLFVGGMATCERASAVQMLYTDEDNRTVLPRPPKILYAVGIPIMWFWVSMYDEADTPPALPQAFNPEFFTIVYDYEVAEFLEILKLDPAAETEVDPPPAE